MRIAEYLRAQAIRLPDRDAVVCADRRLSFAALHDAVERFAYGLSRLGVGPGDRIAVCLPNSVEFVVSFLAACRLGAPMVPINPKLTDAEIAHLLSDSAPSVLVTVADRADALGVLLSRDASVVVAGDHGGDHTVESLCRGATGELVPVPLGFDDCAICYTSGTTGRPKGVVLTQANYIVAHGYLNAVSWGLNSTDRTLVTTPMAHRSGLARTVNMVCHGSCVVIMPKFDVEEAARLIETEQISVLGMVPTVGRMLIDEVEARPQRFSSLRTVLATGEAFPPALADRFEAALPSVRVYAFFAMTEVGQISGLDPRDRVTHRGSVGRPVPGLEVRLVDPTGALVPAGETGEIVVRSGAPGQFLIMRGYFNHPKETSEVLRDGWLATGDLGRFDADGFLYLVDRKKDMVVSGGYNVYSREVEDTIRELPGVAEAAVVGVPDEHYGESVVAFVQPSPGSTVTHDEVIAHCRERLAGYKKPRHVLFRTELPRSATGKLLKRVLRETLLTSDRTG